MKVSRTIPVLMAGALVITAAPVFAGRAPAAGTSTITGGVAAPAASLVETILTTTAMTGDLALNVNQAVPSGSSIVMTNLDLPDGMAPTGAIVTITALAGTTCDTADMVVTFVGDDITAKGFACYDSTAGDVALDGIVNFTYAADDIVATNAITVAGDYAVSSQHRTNPNRKNKSYSWVVSNPTAANVFVPEG